MLEELMKKFILDRKDLEKSTQLIKWTSILDHLSQMIWLEELYKNKNALRSVNCSYEPRRHDDLNNNRLGRSTMYSSQNCFDIWGDLQGILMRYEVSIWRTLAGLIQNMCLFVNSGVTFINIYGAVSEDKH